MRLPSPLRHPGARRIGTIALFVLALGAATYPVWRLALLGSQPTLEELLRLTCSATSAAGPPTWLIERGVFANTTAAATTSPAAADSRASPN